MKLQDNLLNSIRNRPRFKIETNLSVELINQKLKIALETQNKIGGYVRSYESIFRVRASKQEYWSPIVTLRVEKNEEKNQTEIRGIIGPKSSIWLIFMFLYFGLGTLILISGMMYFVAYHFEEGFYIGLVFFISIFLFLSTYLFAKIGEIKAKNEVLELRNFVENAFLEI